VLPGGGLFSAEPAGAWWAFRRGRRPRRGGPRYPEPGWQSALPEDIAARARLSRLGLLAIPAGLWIRPVGAGPAPLQDLAYGVPCAADRLALVVGAASGELAGDAAEVDDVARVLQALPAALRATCVVMPCGPQVGPLPLAQRLADLVGGPVRCCHGIVHRAADGTWCVTAMGRSGQPAWRPFVTESVYHPGAGSPVPAGWVPPAAGMTVAGPGSYGLAAGWVVDVVPSGLLVRPVGVPAERLATRLPVDPEHVSLTVTCAPGGVLSGAGGASGGVLAAVARLAQALPADARALLRLVAGPGVQQAILTGLADFLRVPLWTLTPDGPVRHGQVPVEVGQVPVEVGQVPASADAAPPPRWVAAPDGFDIDLAGCARPAGPDWRLPGGHPCPALSTAPVHPAEAPPAAALPATVPPATALPAEALPATALPATAVPAGAGEAAGGAAGAGRTGVRLSALGVSSSAREMPPRPKVPPPAVVTPPTEVPPPAVVTPPTEVPPLAEVPPLPAPGGSAGGGEPAEPPQPARPTPTPEPFVLPAGHRSTAEDRQRFRSSLGWRYDAQVRSVASLLAERPGLRSVGPLGDTAMTELVAVGVFAGSGQADVVAAIRSGDAGLDTSYVSCLAAGLRLLPTLQGVVVRGGPADPAAADGYRPGTELVEPAPMVACGEPDGTVPGAVEVLIWSVTARRLTGLAGGGRDGEVVFGPGTVFRVLAVQDGHPRRVLLTEVPAGWPSGGATGERRLAGIRTRLEAAAAARAALAGGAPAAADPAGSAVPPGLAVRPEDQARFAALPGLPAGPATVPTRSAS
jgi:hypothetical protein